MVTAMQINITDNLKQVAGSIAFMGKQAKFAAAVAMTRTAKDIQKAMPAALDRSLDRPTDFTKRGTFVTPARRDKLEAVVGFKDRQAKYMQVQIEGGSVQPKARGIKLPGNIQLNAFGNIPRGLVARLKAAAKSGTLGSAVAKRLNVDGNRRKGAAPIQLFYGQPTGKGWEKAPVGIWRRVPPSRPGGKGKLVPVVVFERKTARYRPRFNFAALAKKEVDQRFADHFNTEFKKATATAR